MTNQQQAVKRSATSFMARQFGRPSGPAGHLVTRLLARGNDRFNRWLVHELLAAVPAPRAVIELGCGPGIALQELLVTYPNAHVIGVDPSTVVLKSARRRNASAVAAGRLTLVSGDTQTSITYGPVDLIVACHVLYFWTNPLNELQRIRDALEPNGHLALGYQLRQNMPPIAQRAFPAEGYVLYDSDSQLAAVLDAAGFAKPEVRIFGDHHRPLGRLALSSPAPSGR
jgi:SAM-dependent methyltransferase